MNTQTTDADSDLLAAMSDEPVSAPAPTSGTQPAAADAAAARAAAVRAEVDGDADEDETPAKKRVPKKKARAKAATAQVAEEAVTQAVREPAAMNPEPQADEGDESPTDTILIYSTRCLRCSHLCPDMPRQFDECHYSNGNEDCPAATMRVLVGINFEKASTAMARALANNDAARVSRIAAKLEDKHDFVRSRVFTMAKEKLLSGEIQADAATADTE